MAEPSIDEMRAALKAQKPEPSIDEMRASLKTSPDMASGVSNEEPAPEPSLGQKAADIGKKALDVTARTLDYPGGFVRSGLASVAGLATGKGEIVKEEDLKGALKGQAPNSAEYLQRLGVPELGSVDIPLFGKTTGRGVAGFVSDVVTDPLTLISKLSKEVPYIKNLWNVPGAASEALGKQIYKSSLGKIDRKVALEAGTETASPVADTLLQHGAPVGGTQKLADRVNDVSQSMGAIRQDLYKKATDLGVSVDMGFPMAKAEGVLDKLRADPGMEPLADSLQELMNRYKSAGKVDIGKLSSWKTNLYNALPDSAWTKVGGIKIPAQQFKAALASDFADAIVKAGNTAEKGLGDGIEAINSKWGPLLDARDPMAKQAQKEFIGGGAQIDHAVLSLGGMTTFAVKKALDLASTTTGRTVIGKALMKAGSEGVANRAFIDAFGPPTQPQATDQMSQAAAPPQPQAQPQVGKLPAPPPVMTNAPNTLGNVMRGSGGMNSLKRPGQ